MVELWLAVCANAMLLGESRLSNSVRHENRLTNPTFILKDSRICTFHFLSAGEIRVSIPTLSKSLTCRTHTIKHDKHVSLSRLWFRKNYGGNLNPSHNRPFHAYLPSAVCFYDRVKGTRVSSVFLRILPKTCANLVILAVGCRGETEVMFEGLVETRICYNGQSKADTSTGGGMYASTFFMRSVT